MLRGLMQSLHAPVYASRLRELVRQIVPHLRRDDAVLDIGCGYGALGRALLDDPGSPKGVEVRGLERTRRGDEKIEVLEYDGVTIPFEDGAFDVLIVADVLHHEKNPERLLAECRRVTRRLLIIKDHKRDGLLAQPRIALIDWAANAPYGVPCLYRYSTLAEWAASHRRSGMTLVHEVTSMRLYPPVVNLVFGRRLQYLAVLERT